MPETLFGITQETIDLTNQIIQKVRSQPRLSTTDKAGKDITVASNVLFGYPLEAPSKKLYPIEDAMRRRVPRWVNPIGGTYAHWKVVSSINSGFLKAGVLEGAVNTAISIADSEKSKKYVTLNMYNKYSDEARFMGRRFEDIAAYTMLATLQSLMIDEDVYIIGGCDAKINKPTSPAGAATLTNGDGEADSASSGSLVASTSYDWAVSALTLHGYLNQQAALAAVPGVGVAGIGPGRIAATDAADETDAATGDNLSTGVGVTAVDLSWKAVKGAWAYNIFGVAHGGGGATKLYLKTVTTNKTTVTTITAGGTGTINSADASKDAKGYEGLLQQIVNLNDVSGTGTYGTMTAYYKTMDGAELNGDGATGITELDNALQSIWNTARISPTMLLVNAQEARSMKALAIGSSATNATRVTVAMDGQTEFQAGASVQSYWNPFTAQKLPVITSLHCAPGTILLVGERVPYPNSETPNNIEIELQQEYYAEEFARVDRNQPLGVTCIGAQKLYFPACCGVIQNIAPTT